MKVDYDYIQFEFEWNYIKDKVLKHYGDYYSGLLVIEDEWGDVLKVYAYEITNINYDKEE